MSRQWPLVTLGEVLKRRETYVQVDASKSYRFAGVYCFGRGVFRGQERMGNQFAYRHLTQISAGDFVYPKLMAWEGAFGIVPINCDGCFVSQEFPVFEPRADRIISQFLGFFFQIPRVWEDVSGASTGTNVRRRRLHPEQFLRARIPLPPLGEQRRVVEQIETLSEQIAEARSLRQQAAAEAEAFVTSVHTSLAGNRVKKIGELVQLDEDTTPVAPTESYPQVGIKSFGGGLFPKDAVEGTSTTYRAFNRLYEGALVLSQVKGWEGAVAVCSADLAGWFVSPEYRTFRCISDEVRPGYLASLVRLEWFWGKLANATRGVGARRERTRPEQFLDIELPMPDVAQQERGEALFAEVDALKRLQAGTKTELDALLPSILDRAFQGVL